MIRRESSNSLNSNIRPREGSNHSMNEKYSPDNSVVFNDHSDNLSTDEENEPLLMDEVLQKEEYNTETNINESSCTRMQAVKKDLTKVVDRLVEASTPLNSISPATVAAPILDAPILHVMDRIEDEVEAHAYEDLVPLEIKLALEDRVFGWTHLTSSFLGHTLFTAGSYFLVYELFALCLEHFYGVHFPVWLQCVRVGCSLWAAFSTYRMVRRRRRVWFRAPYGSKAYRKDIARRRKSVHETDECTALGRMMLSFRHKRVMKRLIKAEKLFAKRHFKIQKQIASPPTQTSPTRPLLLRGLSGDTIFSSSSAGSSSGDETHDLTSYSSTETSPSSSPRRALSSPRRTKRQRRPSFHTKPTSRMESVAHDQILVSTIKNVPYAHGGFFGAAPFLLANPHWISILRYLMPDVYVEISRRVAASPASRLIHWAENNPVVAAYGAAHELEYHADIPNLEWDVFLDPQLVARVELVFNEKEKFFASNISPSSKKGRNILAYYDQELRRRSKALVDKMLIAHGNATALIIEQTGYAKRYNYSRVKRTRRTLGGGIYARQWMAVFAEALKLGVCYDGGLDDSSESSVSISSSRKTASLLDLAASTCPNYSMADAMKIVNAIVKSEESIGLLLDVKSQHVPKRVWGVVVNTLRAAGIRVEGVANFRTEEIRGISDYCTRPVQEIFFFHSAGDLQKACHEGQISSGDKVFFNVGSLLCDARGSRWGNIAYFDPQRVKRNYRIHPFGLRGNDASTIQHYKEQFNLSIGVYCQEFAVDEAAIDLLTDHINKHGEIFDLGFAWGGVNGITVQGICPGRFTSTDGLWNQRYVGEAWDYSKKASTEVE